MKKLMAGALVLSLGLFTLGCGGSTPAKKGGSSSTPPAPSAPGGAPAKGAEAKGAPAPAAPAPAAPSTPEKK